MPNNRSIVLFVCAVVLATCQLAQAVTVSGNIHADLTETSAFGFAGVYSGIGMYSYDDADAIIGNRRDLDTFMWDGALIDFDLGSLNPASVVNAQAVFDGGGSFTGLDVEINDAIASADALKLNDAGVIQFWSTSEGPFGAGVYATAPKVQDLVGYNIHAELTDFNNGDLDISDFDSGGLTGTYPDIGMFSYDRNAIVNNKAALETFMWDGVLINFDIDTLDPASINTALAIFDGSNNLLGIEVNINDASASADALSLLSNGDVQFWSTSEGPFGDGTYTFSRKAPTNDQPVPEPATMLLAALGLGALTLRRRSAA